MAWKPEVQVQGKWCRNALVFATEQEARDSAFDLMFRWMSVQESRAVEVIGEPVTHSYLANEEGNRELKYLDTAPETVPTIVSQSVVADSK